MDEGILRNLIRIGTVSSINAVNGTVRVLFEDKDNMVSCELPMLSNEYNMPSVKDQVLCLFLANGIENGFCIGRYYSEINKPPVQSENIYCKRFDDGTLIQYDKSLKELTINSKNPLTINGDFKVNGNITATGDVTAANITR